MVRYAKTLVPSLVLIPALFGFCLDNDIHPVIGVGPSSLIDGTSGTVTITVDQAGSTDTILYISTSAPSNLIVPVSVDLPAGQTQISFLVTAAATGSGSGTVTATANGYAATTGSIRVAPRS